MSWSWDFIVPEQPHYLSLASFLCGLGAVHCLISFSQNILYAVTHCSLDLLIYWNNSGPGVLKPLPASFSLGLCKLYPLGIWEFTVKCFNLNITANISLKWRVIQVVANYCHKRHPSLCKESNKVLLDRCDKEKLWLNFAVEVCLWRLTLKRNIEPHLDWRKIMPSFLEDEGLINTVFLAGDWWIHCKKFYPQYYCQCFLF